jgi:TolA-binding protein
VIPDRDPIPGDLERLYDAQQTPEPPAGLEDRLLEALRASTGAAPASPDASAAPSLASSALGKFGLLTTVAALVGGSAAGVAIGRALPREAPAVAQSAQQASDSVDHPPSASETAPGPRAPAGAPASALASQTVIMHPVRDARAGAPAKAPEMSLPDAAAPSARETGASGSASALGQPAAARPPPELPPTPRRDPASRSTIITAEQKLIETARTAILRQDAAHARAPLEEHARRFPKGALTEEREALLIQTFVIAGEHEAARARFSRFAARYPQSLFLPALEASLVPEGP